MNDKKLSSSPVTVFLVSAGFLFLYRFSALTNPPYWDSILGMFHEAIWLSENDFSYVKLAREQLGYLVGGPRTYFFSWLPGFYAVLITILPSPESVFVTLHVLNVLASAAIAGLMMAILHKPVGAVLAVSVTVAMVLQPMFVAQASMVGSDILITVFSLAGFWAYLQRRHTWAVLAMIVAVTVKPTPALLSICLAGGFVLFHFKSKRDLVHLGGYLLPVLFFFSWGPMANRLFFRPETNPVGNDTFLPPGASRLEYLWGHVVMMFNQVPDVMALVALVILVHVIVIFWALRKNLFKPMSWREVLLPFETPLILTLALGALTLQSILLISWLPRYMLFLYPAIFILLALALKAVPRQASLPILGILTVFFVANHHGHFYQAPILNNGYVLERSLEYEDDLALNQTIAETLTTQYAERTVLAHWPQAQLLSHPGFGYVKNPLDVVALERPAMAWYAVPYFGELPIEQRRSSKNIWVDARNLFGTNLGIRPGVDVLETEIDCQGRKAYLWKKIFRSTH